MRKRALKDRLKPLTDYCQRISSFHISRRRCLMLSTSGIVFALASVCVAFRLHLLNDLPPGLHFDEAVNGINALRVLQGKHSVFFPESTGREGMFVYLAALSIALFGQTVLALRIPAALASVGVVFAVFWLGKALFGQDTTSGRATPWRGLLVGGVGAGLMAVSIDQTFMGRMAFRANLVPLILTLSLIMLWRGWRQQSWWQIALAGVGTGCLPYTYISARFVPFILFCFGASFVLPFHSVSWARIRTELPWIGLFLGVSGAIAAPILIHFALYPHHFFMRSDQLWIFNKSHEVPIILSALLENAWTYLLLFGIHSDQYWHRYSVIQMMLDPYEASFFWLGVGLAIWRWRHPTYRLLLLWLGVMILPGLLAVEAGSNTFGSHHVIRLSGAAPAVYLLSSVGVWETASFLKANFFEKRISIFAIVVSIVAGGFFLIQGVYTYRTYFQSWANEPDMPGAYGTAWRKLADSLNKQPSDSKTVYIVHSSYPYWRYSLEYLYKGTAPIRVLNGVPNLASEIQATIASGEDVTSVKLVQWNTYNFWIREDVERSVFLLGKYGRFLGSDEFADFQIHHYTDFFLERPWTFYERLEPLTVHYDGGISFRGFALGQGTEQLSFYQQFDLSQDHSWWIAMHWQTASGLQAIYSISLRLHDAEGGLVYQHDAVLENSTSLATNKWPADEPVDTLHFLEFPSELPPGDYELSLIVYDFETLTPIVELGVGEPETILSRLRVSATK